MSLKPFFEEEVEFFNHWFSNHPWELHTHDLATDMREEGGNVIVEMHLPEDIGHEDITIELIGDNRLKVSGSCESMHEELDEDECPVEKDCCSTCTGDKCCRNDSCKNCAGTIKSESKEHHSEHPEHHTKHHSAHEAHEEGEECDEEYECDTFEQIVLLPANVNAEKATAELKHGTLTISMPMTSGKKHEPKKINITVR